MSNTLSIQARGEIRQRLQTLAMMLGYLYKMDFTLEENECCGLSLLLNDIADMICREDK